MVVLLVAVGTGSLTLHQVASTMQRLAELVHRLPGAGRCTESTGVGVWRVDCTLTSGHDGAHHSTDGAHWHIKEAP